jgi:hypothetical protein
MLCTTPDFVIYHLQLRIGLTMKLTAAGASWTDGYICAYTCYLSILGLGSGRLVRLCHLFMQKNPETKSHDRKIQKLNPEDYKFIDLLVLCWLHLYRPILNYSQLWGYGC